MAHAFRILPLVAVVLFGCAAVPPSAGPGAPPPAPRPCAPAWVAGLLDVPVDPGAAAAARSRLFRTRDDGELFAGLVAFARAADPELRKVAAFHLAGMVPVAERCGVSSGPAVDALRRDSDPEVRRLANLATSEEVLGGPVPTGMVDGEAGVGEDRAIPYPGLPHVRVHLVVNRIEGGRGVRADSIAYRAEGRIEDGGVLGAAGSEGIPEMTGSGFLGMLTDEGQYGWNLWLRVLDDGTVRWWLQGLRRPLS
jgi:hypothetical protein